MFLNFVISAGLLFVKIGEPHTAAHWIMLVLKLFKARDMTIVLIFGVLESWLISYLPERLLSIIFPENKR